MQLRMTRDTTPNTFLRRSPHGGRARPQDLPTLYIGECPEAGSIEAQHAVGERLLETMHEVIRWSALRTHTRVHVDTDTDAQNTCTMVIDKHV